MEYFLLLWLIISVRFKYRNFISFNFETQLTIRLLIKMELFDALFSRRSIRKYTDKKVDKSKIEKIIKAGMYAPSAVNKQPWHFLVFEDKKKVSEIIQVHPNAGMLEKASAGILICFDKDLQHDDGYGPVDCSAATQNMLLAAHGLGLGACWIGVYPRAARIDALHKLFSLPEHVVPFAVISIGYPAQERKTPNRFDENRIHYDNW